MELELFNKHDLELKNKSIFIPVEENFNIKVSNVFEVQVENIKNRIEYLKNVKKDINIELKALKIQYEGRKEIFLRLLLLE